MIDTFNFQEALSYIKSGLKVSLTLNNITRSYFLDESGNIICIPHNQENLAYKVKIFYIDAIMSDNWQLIS